MTPALLAPALMAPTLLLSRLLGAGLSPVTHLFLGWFGPRGLATLLYGLLLVDESSAPHKETLFTIAIITVPRVPVVSTEVMATIVSRQTPSEIVSFARTSMVLADEPTSTVARSSRASAGEAQ